MRILETSELARYYQDWGQQEDRALFAVRGTQVLGACWSRCFAKDTPGYGTIDPEIPELSIAVLPEQRGGGIGTTLLDHFLTLLQKEYVGVSLSVHKNNPAVHWYQGFGFLVHRVDKTAMIMVKWLD
jgi:ribosomal protein S18 acetylase RimI-like enzyme